MVQSVLKAGRVGQPLCGRLSMRRPRWFLNKRCWLISIAAIPIVLSIFSVDTFAASFYARRNGTWEDLAVATTPWSTGSCNNIIVPATLPTAADDVIICSGMGVEAKIQSPSIRSITFNQDGVIRLSGSANTLNISNYINVVAGSARLELYSAPISEAIVGKSLAIQAGATFIQSGNANLKIAGDVLNNGTYKSENATLYLNGSVDQALYGSGTTTAFNVILDKSGGRLILGKVGSPTHSLIVSNTLTLTKGLIQTSNTDPTSATNYVSMTTASLPNAGVNGGSTSSYVNGRLRMPVAAGNSSPTWQVGGTLNYAPVTVTFSGASAGFVEVLSKDGDHPNVLTTTPIAQLDISKSVNQYWTITNVNSITYSNLDVLLSYPAANADYGVSPTTMVVGQYVQPGGNVSPVWYYPDVGTSTTTSTKITGLMTADGLGDFYIANFVPKPFANWRMDQLNWGGTASEVVDSGSGNFPGTASNALGTGNPTTSRIDPVRTGNPGTCSYGLFDRSKQQFIAIADQGARSFPNLGVDAGWKDGFTLTAWIRSTDISLNAQRIIVDDFNNSKGWGLSLNQTNTINFYMRGTSPDILWAPTNSLQSNRWYFVTAVFDGLKKRRRLYVYDTAGALIANTSDFYSGTVGSDAGNLSIGGEYTNSLPNPSDRQFAFSGNIDEVNVFQSALSVAALDVVRAARRECPGLRMNRYLIQRENL